MFSSPIGKTNLRFHPILLHQLEKTTLDFIQFFFTNWKKNLRFHPIFLHQLGKTTLDFIQFFFTNWMKAWLERKEGMKD